MGSLSSTKQGNFATVVLTDYGHPADFVFRTMQQNAAARDGRDHAPHRHEFYTIIWVTAGTGTHQVDFNAYRAVAGTIFFISPEQVHDLRMDGPHEGFVLLFTEDFIERQQIGQRWVRDSGFFFRCDDVAPLQLTSPVEEAVLKDIMGRIASEYQEKETGYEDALGALLRLFLVHCARLSSKQEPMRQERIKAGPQTIRQFKDLLDSHFREWHKVADYARAMHLTANYLNEVVSRETGKSAKEMILARLILEAKRYATHSDMSVKEVAYKLGFTDPAHFSRVFARQETIAFSAFRDSIRKKSS
jgi:AraC-like DNA-binding protein/quercetin dioxygenase-like cupin family protein